jgi:diguanylate cyclase (GGDEF)-like protein
VTTGALPPALTRELADRSRTSARFLVALAAGVLPAWAGFDRVLEPALAPTFLVVRLVSLVPVLGALLLLVVGQTGRRHPGLLAFLALSVVQVDIAWMAVRVEHLEAYLLGLSLALYASGALLADRPRWTGALAGTSWVATAAAVLTAPAPLPSEHLASAVFYLATVTLCATLAHGRRQQLAVRELAARVRLEDEQRRTGELLVALDRLSNEDALTGLANRRRWDAGLAAACAATRADGGPVTVVLIDVDHFKQVNDRHGHAGGDALLRELAGLLRSRVRGTDLAARIGGDELAVLLPGADLDRAVRLAEQLRTDALALRPLGQDADGVSVSLGVATAAGADADPETLLAAADAQLYLAKQTRNAVRAPAGRTPARTAG